MNRHMPSKYPGPLDYLAAALIVGCAGFMVAMALGWI